MNNLDRDQTNNPEVESQLRARNTWSFSNQELVWVLYRLSWLHSKCCITGSFPLTHYLHRMPIEEARFYGDDACRVKQHAHFDDIDLFFPCDVDHDFIPEDLRYPLEHLLPRYNTFLRACKEKGIEVFCQHQTLLEQHQALLEQHPSCGHGRRYDHLLHIRFIFNLRLFKGGQLLPGKIQLIFLKGQTLPVSALLNWGQYVTTNFDIDIVRGVAYIDRTRYGFLVQTSIPPSIKNQIHRGVFRYSFKHYPSFLTAYSRILKYQRRGFKLQERGGLIFEPHQSPVYIAYIMRRLNCVLSSEILGRLENGTGITIPWPLHDVITSHVSTPIARCCRSFHRMIKLGDLLTYVQNNGYDWWGNQVEDFESFEEITTRSRNHLAARIIQDVYEKRRPVLQTRKRRRSNQTN